MTSERQYYETLWSTADWGGREPNLDEQVRLRAILSALQRHAPQRKKLRVLDIGCGRGWLANAVRGNAGLSIGDIVGIEPIVEAVAIANRLFPDIAFHVCSYQLDTDREIGTFDIVISSEVIEHVPYSEKSLFLKRAASYLRDDGILLLTTPRRELFKEWQRHQPVGQPIEDWMSEAELKAAVTSTGLAVLEHRRIWYEGAQVHISAILAYRLRMRGIISRVPPLELFYRHANSIYQMIVCNRAPNK